MKQPGNFFLWVPGAFKEGMDVLDSNCIGKCSDHYLLSAVRHSSPEEYSQLYDKIKLKIKLCQRHLLSAFAKALDNEEFLEVCLELEEEQIESPLCKLMLRDMNIIKERVSGLAELAYGSDVLKTTEAQAPCLDCVDSTNREDKSFKWVSSFIHNLQDQIQCSELEPGQENRIYPGTSLDDRSYNIKKAQDGTYSITLNLKFSADEDYDGDVPKDQVPAYYMREVQNCLNKANEKMLGPDGEKLKIVIQAPKKQDTDRCENSDTKEIAIGSQEHRSHARKYESDIDCPAITHEILHLLGLCDEYKEKAMGYYVDPKTGYIVGSISNVFNVDDRKNKKLSEKGYEFKPSYDCRVTMTNSIMSDQDERWDNVFKNGKNDSLLTPRQFNAILYGSCEEKNKIFNECSQLAYQSSV